MTLAAIILAFSVLADGRALSKQIWHEESPWRRSDGDRNLWAGPWSRGSQRKVADRLVHKLKAIEDAVR